MLKHTIRESARRAIEARFKLRDEVLAKELDQLAAVAGDQDVALLELAGLDQDRRHRTAAAIEA